MEDKQDQKKISFVLFIAPGVLGPHTLLYLLQHPKVTLKAVVLATKIHSVPADDIRYLAKHYHIPLLEPTDITTDAFRQEIEKQKPDLLLVSSYDRILPESILAIPKKGAFNLHPSLLPKYRGACPEFWVVRNGENKTGVTLHHLTSKVDSGNIVFQKELYLGDRETLGTLLHQIASAAMKIIAMLIESCSLSLPLLALPQDESLVTEAPLVQAQDLEIDWGKSVKEIDRLVRAANPIAGAWTFFRGKVLKVWSAEILSVKKNDLPVGSLSLIPEHEKICVQAKDGLIELKSVQQGLQFITDGWNFVRLCAVKEGERLVPQEALSVSSQP